VIATAGGMGDDTVSNFIWMALDVSKSFKDATFSDWTEPFRRQAFYEATLTLAGSIGALAASVRYWPYASKESEGTRDFLCFCGFLFSCVVASLASGLKWYSLSHSAFGVSEGWKMANEAGLVFVIDSLKSLFGPKPPERCLSACLYRPLTIKRGNSEEIILEQVTDYVGYVYPSRADDDGYGQKLVSNIGVVGRAYIEPLKPVVASRPSAMPPDSWQGILTNTWSMPPDVRARVNPDARAFFAFGIAGDDNSTVAVLYCESNQEDFFDNQRVLRVLQQCAGSFAGNFRRY